MPELRKDPVTGRWVIIATERAQRPTDFKFEAASKKGGKCPFCEGSEATTPPEIVAFRNDSTPKNGPGWRVRVVANKFPALRVEGDIDKRGDGMYDIITGIGAHEVIIEHPQHKLSMSELSEENVAEVLWMYRERLLDLKKDTRLVYGLIFKNVGEAAGASLEHSHSQLIATPIVPLQVQGEMDRCTQYSSFRGRCLFCDMIKQEISTGSRVISDGHHFVAFAPFAARFPFETWILPKRHASHFEAMNDESMFKELASLLRSVLRRLEGAMSTPPYNYLIHTAPLNEPAMEHYHWHFEIIPRVTRVAGFEWGTGFYINPVPPENAAQYLKDIKLES